MKNKDKLRLYLENHPHTWLATPTAKIAEATGLHRPYVDDMIPIVAAEKFADALPDEYKRRRRLALRGTVQIETVKALLRKGQPIENIAFIAKVSVDWVRQVKRKMEKNGESLPGSV